MFEERWHALILQTTTIGLKKNYFICTLQWIIIILR